MNAEAVLRGMASASVVAGDAAVARVAAAVAARAETEFPEVATQAGDGEVRLRAPGLLARAFGTRQRAADARLQGLVAMLRTGGGL